MKHLPEPEPEEVGELVERIRPILAGKHPALTSAVLADLVAIWLSGYQAHDGVAESDLDLVRAEFLEEFNELVRQLLPVNDDIIKKRRAAGDKSIAEFDLRPRRR